MSTVNGEVGHLVGQLLQLVCDHTFVDERCKNAVQTEVELVVLGNKVNVPIKPFDILPDSRTRL